MKEREQGNVHIFRLVNKNTMNHRRYTAADLPGNPGKANMKVLLQSSAPGPRRIMCLQRS